MLLRDEVGIKQDVVFTEEDAMCTTGARANVTQCENEIERDSVRASRAR